MELLQKSSQMITCKINCKIQKRVVQVSAIYVGNNQVDRKDLWTTINQMKTSMSWLVLGDFNCVRFGHEKMGGIPLDSESMEKFN